MHFLHSSTIEGYDDRVLNQTFSECADFCKTIAGCYGFAYDKKTNTCYPAKEPIMGKPYNALHSDMFSEDNVTCNKGIAIDEPLRSVPFDERRSNALFICSEREGLQPQMYFHNDNKLTKIDEGQNPDFITEVDAYEVKPYRWPRDKFDDDNLDILERDRINASFNNETVTQLDRIQSESKTAMMSEFSVSNQEKQDQEQDPSPIPINRSRVFQTSALQLIRDVMNLPKDDLAGKRAYYTYRVFDDRNNGAYEKQHKCVKDISLKRCLQNCNESSICKGVEWNPLFVEDENVCCPLKEVGQFVPREESYRLGHFYMKGLTDNLDHGRTYIYH